MATTGSAQSPEATKDGLATDDKVKNVAVELSQGLWAYWKFDEGQGLYADCRIQEQNRGSFEGRPFYRWANGLFGNAVEFYTPPKVKSWKCAGMRFPSYEAPSESGLIRNMTVSVWLYVRQNGLGVGIPLLGRYDPEGEGWNKLDTGWKLSTHAHQVFATSTLVRGDLRTGARTTIGTPGWRRNPESDLFDEADGWHHVVHVSDSAADVVTIYLDNQAIVRTTSHEHDGILPAETGDLRIGWVGNLNLRYDELAIWRRALTPREVSHLFNEGKGREIALLKKELVLDKAPPSPNPMEWFVEPVATGPTAVGMYAKEADDESDYFGLEYRFVCLGNERFSSKWQRSPLFIAMGLEPASTYRFACQSRDKTKNKNETKLSCAVSVQTLKAAPGRLRVFLIAGQSNAEGWCGFDQIQRDTHLSVQDKKALIQPRDDVYCLAYHRGGYLNTDARTRPEIPQAKSPFGYGGKSGNYGLELSFARACGRAFEDDVLVAKLAVGGTFLHDIWYKERDGGWKKPETWFPPRSVKELGDSLGRKLAPGSLFVKLKDLIEKIQKDPRGLYPDYQGQGIDIAGFIWFQGESDSFDLPAPYGPNMAQHRWESPALYYQRNLRNLIADVRDVTGRPDLPVVIIQIQDKSTWDGKSNIDIGVFGKRSDEKISKKEFGQFEKRSDPFRATDLLLDELFSEADKDGDGYLSAEEFKHPAFEKQRSGKGPVIRKAQSDVAAADNNAIAVATSNLAGGYHYTENGSGMIRIGERVVGAILELLSQQKGN